MVNSIQNAALEDDVNDSPPEAIEEFQAMMDDIAAGQRDPDIPEGTLLGETETGGIPTRYHKQSSMHRMGDVALPDRMPLYHYPDNETSLIPTALIMKRLSKTDASGHRIWSRHPHPDGTEVEYIEKTVPMLDGSTMTKRFTSELAYETFMRNKHGDQWEAMLRDEERREREEDRQANRELGEALLAAAGGRTERVAATREPESNTIPTPMLEHLNADGLRAVADEFKVELRDRRSIIKMREDIAAALGGADA